MSVFRHPHTAQERRAAHALLAEIDEIYLGFRLRPRRGIAADSLTSERDDKEPVVRKDRSWKNYRHSQWR